MNMYAAGIFIKNVLGWNNISHDGATASYRAYLEVFPDLQLSIGILSNTSQFNINNVADGIIKIKDFKEYEGQYFYGETNSSAILFHDSSILSMRLNPNKVYQLKPTYKDAFYINDLDCDVRFTRNHQNKITSIMFYFWRSRGIEFIHKTF